MIMEKKKLRKSRENCKLCGVCGGIAEYFDLDPTLVRVLWILLVCAYGSGLLAYLVAALIMPSAE